MSEAISRNEDYFDKFEVFKKLGYAPHDGQLKIHNSDARFRIAVWGRRAGKSKGAAHEIAAYMISHPDTLGWIVAPNYGLTEKIFREVYYLFHRKMPHWIKKSNFTKADMSIELLNGAKAICKSADNEVSLIGEGLHWIVADEAARIKERVWLEALRPTLADFQGWALFITTPCGMNWIKNLWTRGQDPEQKEYESWQFGTVINPHIKEEEIEEARRTLPDRAFRQEWLGEFITEVGGVFRNVRSCCDLTLKNKNIDGAEVFEEWKEGHTYIGSADLGKHHDFTVIMIADLTNKKIIYFDRFNKIDWNLQKKRIEKASKLYNGCRMIIDSRGVGDGIFDDLKRMSVNCTAFDIKSNAVKMELIENLVIAIENKELNYPDIPVMINELEIFEYQVTPSRNVKYSAPEGYFDDCVLSLAMLWTGLKKRESRMEFIKLT